MRQIPVAVVMLVVLILACDSTRRRRLEVIDIGTRRIGSLRMMDDERKGYLHAIPRECALSICIEILPEQGEQCQGSTVQQYCTAEAVVSVACSISTNGSPESPPQAIYNPQLVHGDPHQEIDTWQILTHQIMLILCEA